MAFWSRLRPLVASAARVDMKDGAAPRRNVLGGWQEQIFGYYDRLGIVSFPTQVVAGNIGKLKLLPGYRRDDGTVIPVVAEPTIDAVADSEYVDADAVAVFAGIEDPSGGVSSLAARYAELRWLVGEMLLVGYLLENAAPTDRVRWEVMSTFEMKHDESQRRWVRSRGGGLRAETYSEPPADAAGIAPGEAVVIRLWRPHPKQSGEATSSWRTQVGTLEQITLYDAAVRARSLSRASGPGILFVNADAVDPGAAQAAMDEDPDSSPVMKNIIKGLVTPIQNPASAAAVVPVTVFTRGDSTGPPAQLVRLYDDKVFPEIEMIGAAMQRVAREVDLPEAIITGMARVNHWTGWLVDDQFWQSHLQPIADALADDLADAYYRPALTAMGIESERFTVLYDAEEIIGRPNESDDAKQLHDRYAISDSALRAANGFSDADAPADDEVERRVWIASNGAAGTGPAGETAPAPTQAPPPEPLVAAIEYRLRELAGSRIRNRLRREPDEADYADTPNYDLAAALGEARVADLLGHANGRTLVAGGVAPFVAAGTPSLIAQSVEMRAAANLFTPCLAIAS